MAAISLVTAVIQTVERETRVSEQKWVCMCTRNPEVKEQRSCVTFKKSIQTLKS